MSSLPTSGIEVMVEGGCVTLSGQVDWQYQRIAAATSIQHLLGVTGFSDQIALNPAVSSVEVKSDIEAALKRRLRSDGAEIAVDVRDDEVTLKGTVQSWAERELLTSSAWGARGVRNVVEKMTLAL
jgi:osmotically-inducible protein OsmY